MKAILLVRISTYLQDSSGQQQKLIDFAREKGYTEYKIVSTVESGLANSSDKIGTTEVFKIIENEPEYRTVICSEISRLSRKQSVLHSLIEIFHEKRIQLIVYQPEIKLLQEDGRIDSIAQIMISVFGLFADQEVKMLKERMHTGLKNALVNNYSKPGKVLFGYDRVFDPKEGKNIFIKNEKEGELIQNIFDWYLNGLPDYTEASTVKIARWCAKKGLPKYTTSKRNIQKMLKEVAYTGSKTFTFKSRGNEKLVVEYPQIISLETFNEVQEALKRANYDKKSRRITLLSKKIRCPICRTFFTANYRENDNGRDNSSYRCGRRGKTIPCECKFNIGMRMVESAVWTLLKSNKRFVDSINLQSIETRISEYKTQLYLLDDKINIIDETINYLNAQISDLTTSFSKSYNYDTTEFANKLKDFVEAKNKFELEKIPLQKERIKINQMLQNEESIMDNYDRKLNVIINNETYITAIQQIEKEKSTVKQYIDYYIQRVNILSHNKKITLLDIVFKAPFFEFLHNLDNVELIDFQFPFRAILLIDKHDTNRLKLFWGRLSKTTKIQNDSITTKAMNTEDTTCFYFDDFHSKDEFIKKRIEKYFIELNLEILAFSNLESLN